ncbi:glycosyltransferase family 4 protein [Zooshikella ganghwensis]|uniref:Glycosyltransferase family 1 protein n=1 Tax=Zooshikella ganghwensis TaxID=202772 RepID=A0A4P9VQV1_9GAMM|nr:glycosyltransferase family 4 protein [Zooshikella ganghwensis]RDH45923.1 glycosyltransferase family 1 protein [Zooshikella ganghwensis]
MLSTCKARETPSEKAFLHIISSSGYYGAEHVLVQYCSWLAQYHHYIMCICPDYKTLDLLQQEMAKENTSVYGAVGQKLSLLTLVKSCRQLLKSHNFVAINCHGYKELWVALLTAWKWSIPIIMVQHGFTRRNVKMRCNQWLNILSCRLKKVHMVLCVAKAIAKTYQLGGVPKNKIIIIPNSVDVKRNKLDKNTNKNSDKHTDLYMFGFIGRLSVEKGPDLFLNVCQSFVQRYSQAVPVKAVIIGDGPLQQVLMESTEQNHQPQIDWVGYQSDIQYWLQQIKILLITSRTEGTPLCALEAMAFGVPVIAFAVGGLVDLIEHEQTGLLVPPNDLNLFVDTVYRLQQDDILQKKIIKNALAKVEWLNHQSREKVLTCYRQLLI